MSPGQRGEQLHSPGVAYPRDPSVTDSLSENGVAWLASVFRPRCLLSVEET